MASYTRPGDPRGPVLYSGPKPCLLQHRDRSWDEHIMTYVGMTKCMGLKFKHQLGQVGEMFAASTVYVFVVVRSTIDSFFKNIQDIWSTQQDN